jgi:cation transport regulator
MPYSSLSELPDAVKDNLPSAAQEIYLAAFNDAWQRYARPEERRDEASREEVAHKVAWSAVKQKYEKRGDDWVARNA